MTTEHFTLQGARAATAAESTGRATMFLGSVSAGLVALGLIATATRIGTAFYAFGLILLSTLSFVGFVTFQRVLQSGIEDHGYAERIARLRTPNRMTCGNSGVHVMVGPGHEEGAAAAVDRPGRPLGPDRAAATGRPAAG